MKLRFFSKFILSPPHPPAKYTKRHAPYYSLYQRYGYALSDRLCSYRRQDAWRDAVPFYQILRWFYYKQCKQCCQLPACEFLRFCNNCRLFNRFIRPAAPDGIRFQMKKGPCRTAGALQCRAHIAAAAQYCSGYQRQRYLLRSIGPNHDSTKCFSKDHSPPPCIFSCFMLCPLLFQYVLLFLFFILPHSAKFFLHEIMKYFLRNCEEAVLHRPASFFFILRFPFLFRPCQNQARPGFPLRSARLRP